MCNSLWSWPKELALNRKLQIYMISEKEDNLHIFENVFLGNFRFICFSSSNCRNFRFNSLLFRNSTISLFSRTYPRKFPHHLSPFLKFRSFWLNGKSPKCEYQSGERIVEPSLPSVFFFQNGSHRTRKQEIMTTRIHNVPQRFDFFSLFSWRRRRRKKGKQHCRNCDKCLLPQFWQFVSVACLWTSWA